MVRLDRIGASLLLLLPAWLSLDFVGRYGVDVPVMDDWDLVPTLARWAQGTLTFEHLFSLHNEHRIFFPRLVMLGVAQLTHYNVHALMLVTWLFLLGTAVLLLAEHLATFGATARALLWWAPAAWLLFSLRQHQNLLWGWQVQFTMCVFFAVAAVLCLQHAPRRAWLLGPALAAAVVASFSLAGGFGVWPAGLLQLVVLHRVHRAQAGRRVLALAGAWLAAGAACLFAYLHRYVENPSHPSKLFFLRAPGKVAHYLLIALGNPLAGDAALATAAGLCLLAVAGFLAWAAKKGHLPLERAAFPLALVVFGLAVAAMLAVGRGAWGSASALSSRYATTSALVAYGLFRAGWAVQWPPGRRLLGAALAPLLALCVFTFFDHHHALGAQVRASREAAGQLLFEYRRRPERDLEALHPDFARTRPGAAAELRRRAEVLEALGYTVFAGAEP